MDIYIYMHKYIPAYIYIYIKYKAKLKNELTPNTKLLSFNLILVHFLV